MMLHSYPPPMGQLGCQQGPHQLTSLPSTQQHISISSSASSPHFHSTPSLPAFRLWGHGDCLFRRHLIPAELPAAQHKETLDAFVFTSTLVLRNSTKLHEWEERFY